MFIVLTFSETRQALNCEQFEWAHPQKKSKSFCTIFCFFVFLERTLPLPSVPVFEILEVQQTPSVPVRIYFLRKKIRPEKVDFFRPNLKKELWCTHSICSQKKLRCTHSICSQLRAWRVADHGNAINMNLGFKTLKHNPKSTLTHPILWYSLLLWRHCRPIVCLGARTVYTEECHVFEIRATVKSYPSSTFAKNPFCPPHT